MKATFYILPTCIVQFDIVLLRPHIISERQTILHHDTTKNECRFQCANNRALHANYYCRKRISSWRSLVSQLSGSFASICGIVIALLTWCTPADELSIMFYEISDDCFLLLQLGASELGRGVIYLPGAWSRSS